MSKGQQAIVVAKICLETKQSVREAAKQSGLKNNRVAYAFTILRHAPDLAASVIAGSISLDNAYEEARIRKGRAETYEARFDALKATAPDLADMVTDGPLNLEEAQAAYDQRVSEEGRRKKGMARLIFPWRLKLGGVNHG
jgi:hypothetical protein